MLMIKSYMALQDSDVMGSDTRTRTSQPTPYTFCLHARSLKSPPRCS